MTRLLIGLLLVLSASPALAEGPGTRIRSGSQLPQPPQIVQRAPVTPCARLQGDARERCLEEARKSAATRRPSGAGAPR